MNKAQHTAGIPDPDFDTYDISGGGLITKGLSYFRMSLSRWQQAIVLLCITWLPLAILTLRDGTFFGGVAIPFISDYTRQGRVLLGIPMLILIHNVVYKRMPLVLQYMAEVLMLPRDREQFMHGALHKAKVHSNSTWMQSILLMLVIGVALSPMGGARFFDTNAEAGSWILSRHGEAGKLSAAGRWMQYVSIPVFQFLMVRWLWRYATWVLLIYRISKIPLQLRPTHPDGAGGLGILILAQRSFNSLFFVFGIVLSSNMVSGFVQGIRSFDTIKVEIFGFVVLALIITFLPLLFFTRMLIRTKYLGQLYLGRAGLNASERFEDEWVRQMSEKKEKAEDTMDPSFHTDYTSLYRYLQDFSIIPIRLGDIVVNALVLFLPFIPVFFMQYSVIELLEKLMGVLI
jgi:hypothetical protein